MQRKIKILDVINTAASARELLVRRVAAVNEDPRFENWIVCGDGRHLQALRDKGIPFAVIESPRGISLRHVSPRLTLRAFRELVRLIRRERFDIVHTHGSVQGVFGRLAAWICRVPVVMHLEHGSLYFEGQPGWEGKLYQWMDRTMATFTDYLLYQNPAEMDYAVRARLTGSAQAVYIGTGVDLSDFRCRERLQADDGKRRLVIANVARPDPIKNHKMLLEAVDRLRSRFNRFELWILGEGILDEELKQWVATRGLEPWVRFWGYRDDVPRLLEQSDIAVLTSIKEGIPRGVMEPMAMGIPVVGTRVKGTRDVIEDGKSGILVELNDAEGLEEGLYSLLTNESLRRDLGIAGRKRIEEEFDDRNAIGKLIATYETASAAIAAQQAQSGRLQPGAAVYGERSNG